MKVGDLVIKLKGRHAGLLGIIIEIHNPNNNTVLSVISEEGVVAWAQQLVKVIKKEIK